MRELAGAFYWRRFISIYTVIVEKPQYCLCWPTSVSFIMTVQKGGLDKPSKLSLCEQKYSLSWGKKEIILIYNALHLTFPQYPPTSELLYLEMWWYIKHCEFKIFLFLAVCLELFYRMCSAFIFISKLKFIGMIYWLVCLGIFENIVLLLFSFCVSYTCQRSTCTDIRTFLCSQQWTD